MENSVGIPQSLGNATRETWIVERPGREEMFKAGVEWADAHPHWISVKDRFPDSLHVLVYDEREGVKMATLTSRYNNDWECLNKDIYLLEVTHWMELPEEPSDLEN
jgi:hypothetical protein